MSIRKKEGEQEIIWSRILAVLVILSLFSLPTFALTKSTTASCSIPWAWPRCWFGGCPNGLSCDDTSSLSIPNGARIIKATVSWTQLNDEGRIFINGNQVYHTNYDFGNCCLQPGSSKDVTNRIRSGSNSIGIHMETWAWGSDGARSATLSVDYCDINQGQSCGSCGGKIQCDGSCSVSLPTNFGDSCSSGTGECRRTGTIKCDGSCSASPGSPSTEICDNKDNSCNGAVDNGCDDDNDNYCEAGINRVGTPSTCTAGGNDLNDNDNTINPGATEICDNKNNNQVNGVDEGCDDDNDNYCESGITRVGTPSTCTAGGNDCSDNNVNINPGATEICDNIDNDCVSGIDDGCDNDKDGFVNPLLTCIGSFRDGNGIIRSCP
jgi:hypothetical protein|tara:strand:+ start:547 stop:1683 length:1137 start_codon:yes stop_codon:yes gene_type:complete